MGDHEAEIGRILAALDEADRALVGALDARAEAIRGVLALRAEDPEGYYVLPRERDVLAAAIERAKTFPASSLEPVLREVLSACAALIAPVTVSYLGPEGGFTHVAARRHFGRAAELSAVDSVADVIDAVARERTTFGVVPLESSSDGAMTATLHGLADGDVKICAELTLAASYHLLSKTGNAADIEKIYGAPQAVAAAERFLRSHHPRATLLDVPSGEVAAQFATEDHGAAAVGTDIVAELHGLEVVHERIEDVAGIETRFAVVGTDLPPRTGADRTVLALAVHDSPGALYHALQPFADRGINLTRLESRPARNAPWRYLFFVELDGHVTDRAVLTAVEEVRGSSRHIKVLGSYPRPS